MTLSTPVTVRPAALTDLPHILEMEQLAPSAAHWSPDQYRRLIDEGIVLVAEQGAVVCGFVCAKAVAGEWEIENVVVSRAFLRRGVARQLVHELVRRAESASASAVLLEVRESNLAARGLYEKFKFLEVGRRARYYSNPTEDAILYALYLQP